METLNIEGTPKTPTINFNEGKSELLIKGRSIPENSIEFYKPLNTWLENYAQSGTADLKVNVMLEYFNTSSSKCILDVFKRLEGIKDAGKGVSVVWHYEEDDEDMLEAGEDYQAIINLPFTMAEIEE